MSQFAALVVVLFVCGLLAMTNADQRVDVEAHIQVNVFSGSKNPKWTITNSDQIYDYLLPKLTRCANTAVHHESNSDLPPFWFESLGYQGIDIHIVQKGSKKVIAKGRIASGFMKRSCIVDEQFELELLETAPAQLISKELKLSLAKQMKQHQQKDRKNSLKQDEKSISMQKEFIAEHKMYIMHTSSFEDQVKLPQVVIRGPDNVTAYNPKKWNVDPIQYENNCYNYGSDVRTDTFAQPGRGSGQKWKENSCPDVIAASVRDGMIYAGNNTQPTNDPEVGHLVALVMADGFNFHWYKRDLGKMWSHKPGQTPVRDVDNSGRPISDPLTADRGWYTHFCCYMIAVPSKLNLN